MIKIIDNVLPFQMFMQFQTYINHNTKWEYQPHMDYSHLDDEPYKDSFVHHVFERDIHSNLPTFCSNDYYMYLGFLEYLEEHLNLKTKDLIRCRTHMTNRVPEDIIKRAHNDDDQLNDYIIGVFYVNNSDGDTIIFDSKDPKNKEKIDLPIKASIEPKANRLVLFDGNYLHSASKPINNSKRIIINLNWREDDRSI